MTTRRCLLVFGLLAGALALGGGVWLFWSRPSAITRENAAKIQIGMTLAEVEAIMGGPERDESTGRLEQDGSADHPSRREFSGALIGKAKNWRSDRVIIDVYLDGAGQVLVCFRLNVLRVQESPVAILRRWLRL